MLKAAIVEAVREEVRAALHGVPSPASVAEDLGTVLGMLPQEDAVEFAKVLLSKLFDFVDNATPEPAGAEGTGEQEE